MKTVGANQTRLPFKSPGKDRPESRNRTSLFQINNQSVRAATHKNKTLDFNSQLNSSTRISGHSIFKQKDQTNLHYNSEISQSARSKASSTIIPKDESTMISKIRKSLSRKIQKQIKINESVQKIVNESSYGSKYFYKGCTLIPILNPCRSIQ